MKLRVSMPTSTPLQNCFLFIALKSLMDQLPKQGPPYCTLLQCSVGFLFTCLNNTTFKHKIFVTRWLNAVIHFRDSLKRRCGDMAWSYHLPLSIPKVLLTCLFAQVTFTRNTKFLLGKQKCIFLFPPSNMEFGKYFLLLKKTKPTNPLKYHMVH